MAPPPKTAGQIVARRRPGEPDTVAPEQDDRLMRRIRSDRMMSTPAQAYRQSHGETDLELRDAAPPPPGYRYTLDGRLIPIEGTELPITDAEAQQLFCDVIEITGSFRAACDALGIRSMARVKGYMMRDPDFAESYEASAERHRESLMAHAVQRATVGVKNPIFSKDGDLLGYETKHSDGLLKTLLERHFPDMRKGGVVVNNTTQNNLTIEGDMLTNARAMTREQRAAARLLLRDKSELPEEDTNVIDVESETTDHVEDPPRGSDGESAGGPVAGAGTPTDDGDN